MKGMKQHVFCAWDGEAINGKYFLLQNSRGEKIVDQAGLSTDSILAFLHGSALRHRKEIHVIFGGGYDVNMWIKDLSLEQLIELHENNTTKYKEWTLTYLHRKSFSLTRGKQSVTLWDVFGFFQTSFVQTIRQFLKEYDEDIIATIERHKKERSTFSSIDVKEICDYCQLEVEALEAIMVKLDIALQTAGLVVNRWDGAGAIAASLLKREKVKQHQQDMTVNYPHIRSAAWHAYAGGRIECVKYGHHVGKVYHYDICSAYPSACLALPSFSGRENWQRVCTIKDVFGVWKVSWDYSRRQETPFYPFFYRSPNGSICYPPKGQGWYYTPEVLTALKWMSDSVTIEEGYIWGSNNATVSSQVGGSAYSCESIAQEWPFTFVEQVYQQRKEYKKQGNQAQIALKLGMNSLYGKLAQQTGYGTKTPTYQQIEWAGYITSTTRAKLFDVAMQHPDDVIMFATDGLFSLAEHDVDVGNDLGQWERTTHDELLVAQSGVYWYRDTGEEWTEKYRGFDRGSIQPDMVLGAYERGEWSVAATSSRFVTLGSGLMSSPKLAHWRTWTQGEDAIRTLKLTALGTKRVDVNPWWTEDDNPSMHLFDTTALINEYAELGMESCRYRHKEAMKIEEREEGDGYL